MATATLSVNGYIDSYDYYDTTSLQKLKDALVLQAPFEAVNVEINSGGGSVTEGLAIHDWLKTLNVPVTTIVNGTCYSIAGPILMAGSVRLIGENSDVMIHPVSGWAEGTAEDIRAYADLMDVYGEKIINIYVGGSGQSAESIRAMMDNTTYLTAAQCVEMGIATGLYTQAQARADRRRQLVNYAARPKASVSPTASTNPPNTLAMSKPQKLAPLESALRTVSRATNKALGKPVNLDLSLQDGSTVFVDSTADTAAVGDKVYTDSTMTTAVADNTYTLAEGNTLSAITTVAGVITAVTAVSSNTETETPSNSSDAVAALEARILALETAAQASNTANAATLGSIEAAVTAMATNMASALGNTHSKDIDLGNKNGKAQNKGIPQAQAPVEAGDRDAMLQAHLDRFGKKKPGEAAE